MRKVKSFSVILRVTGVVLVILALMLLIFATTTNGSEWSSFSERLRQSGVSVKVWDRFSFNRDYYLALYDALHETVTASSIRVENATAHFSGFLNRTEAAEQAALDRLALELESWFNGEFDTGVFLSVYNNLMGNQEAAEVREIFEYLDGLSPTTIKTGKTLPGNLKPASAQPWFEEQYGVWAAQYGEDAGSFLEYMRTFERLIRADGTVTDVKAFAEAVSYESYLPELAVTRNQENTQALVLFVDAFATLAAEKEANAQTDIAGFLSAEYQMLLDRFSQTSPPDYAVFLTSVRDALANLNIYDGSYSMLISQVKQAQSVQDGKNFATFMLEFSRTLIQNSDSRRAVPLLAFLWYLAANAVLLGIIGILLILVAAVMNKMTTDAIIRNREYSTQQDNPDMLLAVKNLSQYFKSGNYVNKAVDNISFHIKKGEVFGLVGESGCGKTTTGRTIINLYDPTSGDVFFKGLRISSTKNGANLMRHQLRKELDKNIAAIKADAAERKKRDPSQVGEIERESEQKIAGLKSQHHLAVEQVQRHAFESEEEKRKCDMLYHDQRKADLHKAYQQDIQGLSGKALEERKKRLGADLAIASRDNIKSKIQMIFQDPIASIDPRMTVREIIAEGLVIRGVKDKELITQKVNEMLDMVGLLPEHASRYPHEFSGGQRQRIGIARAIVLEPELIIADEPISALDVSIQAQIINLLNDLRNRMGLTIMFIAHNLSVVKYFSDRIAVMYYGNIVEMAASEELFLHPLHPYTRSLLSAIPYPDPHYEKQRRRIEYEPVLAHNYQTDKPELHEIVPGHFIHCNQEELLRYRKELGL